LDRSSILLISTNVELFELVIVRFFIENFIQDKIHGLLCNKDNKHKKMDDNLFINGVMDEKEYTSVINKKEKNRDDFEQ